MAHESDIRIARHICAETSTAYPYAECQNMVEGIPLPDTEKEALLYNSHESLLRDCGGNYTDPETQIRYTKESQKVAGCIWGHLKDYTSGKNRVEFHEGGLIFDCNAQRGKSLNATIHNCIEPQMQAAAAAIAPAPVATPVTPAVTAPRFPDVAAPVRSFWFTPTSTATTPPPTPKAEPITGPVYYFGSVGILGLKSDIVPSEIELQQQFGFNDEGKATWFQQIKLRYQLGVFAGKAALSYQIFEKVDDTYVAITPVDQKLEFPIGELNTLAFVFLEGQITIRTVP